MPSYKEFVAHAQKHGFARTNRFQVIIPLPDKITQVLATNTQKSPLAEAIGKVSEIVRIFTGPSTTAYTRGLEMMCMQTELPGKTINVSEGKYNGDVFKVAHSILYGNQQFTFKVSGDMYEKTILDAWMNLIVDPDTHEVGYYKDYVVPISIFQLDTNDNIVHGVVLHDAYPVLTNPLTLSNAEMNNVHELMTQFTYKRWENLDITGMSGSAFSQLAQTPLGPYLTPILSNPVVQRGLDYIKNTTGLNLEGEAMNVYNQVNDIVEKSVGISAGRTTSLLNSTKVKMESNTLIDGTSKGKLGNYINGLLNVFGG